MPVKENLLFCLDFDGTLVRIRRDPDAVYPSRLVVAFLKKMCSLPNRRVVIVSGRAYGDLKKRFSIKGLMMVGSHGRESTDSDLKVSGRAGRGAELFLKKLKKEFGRCSGVQFEKKPHSFVIHYRRAPDAAQKQIERWFAVRKTEFKKSSAHLLRAKKAFEISSYPANKGLIVKKIKKKYPGWRMVIAGDDVTDQDMFRAASANDITIGVGGLRGAKRRVQGPSEMLTLLRTLDRRFS